MSGISLLGVIPSHTANGSLGHLTIDNLSTTDPTASCSFLGGTDGKF